MRQVLLVDDEPYILNILDFTLVSEGFNVVTASNGEEALRKAVEIRPDLIVLDVMMPRLDGFEVCRTLKARPETKKIPVILLTAKDRDVDREKGREVKADGYVTKPFSPSKLVEEIQKFLGSLQSE